MEWRPTVPTSTTQEKYQKQGGNGDNLGKIHHQKSIEEHLALIVRRERIGEWEADTIIGLEKKSAVW